MTATEKLYENDAFLAEFTAPVLVCEPADGGWRTALAATAFYPEGGGQPYDTGILGGAAVTAVHERDGVVWHTVDKPLPVGQTVTGAIDWARRLDHMEQHTGEHILSGCLHRLFGANNVGFHIGDPAVRMDVDLPLTAGQLAQAEAAANAAVRADTPVRCWVPDAAELAATDFRSKKALDGPVRLVAAGGDVCACCGTHLKTTGQVGLIKILSAQPYKGGVRLRVAAGQRAYAAVTEAWSDAEAAGRLLSVGPGRLTAAAETFFAHDEENRIRLAALQRRLVEALAAAPKSAGPVHIVEGLDGRAAADLAQRLAGTAPAAVLVSEAGRLRWVLAAPADRDVRGLAKALCGAFGGRGGGPARLCQGTAPADAAAAAAWLRKKLAGEM